LYDTITPMSAEATMAAMSLGVSDTAASSRCL
jgi:hypothetical protein